MLRWTLKSLLSEPLSLLGSILAVAGAFVLVLFFQAVFRGESNNIVSYLEHSDADVWVMQSGVNNMHMATSLIWDWKADKVAAVEGVESASPILFLNTVLQAGGRRWFSYVVGRRPEVRAGGPWAMAVGRAAPNRGEAVIPEVLARMASIQLGDIVTIAEQRLRVVGLSRGTFSMAASITFVHAADLEETLSTTDVISYILVKATPGTDPAALVTRIEQSVEKVTALPRIAFIRSDFELAMQMGVEVIALMTLIGGALAAIIVAFTAYSHTTRLRHELAIIKAIGARNSAVYLSVLLQAVGITLVGFAVGIVVIALLAELLPGVLPLITLSVAGEDVLNTGLAATAIAALAALPPAYSVARVDPLSAFTG